MFEPENNPTPEGGNRALWTAEHYRAVLRLIASSEYHAVRKNDVWKALEKECSKEGLKPSQVLLSMVEYNLFSLRPYSKLAKDIPRDAFGPNEVVDAKLDDVVTMPSPAFLWAAKELYRDGLLEEAKNRRLR